MHKKKRQVIKNWQILISSGLFTCLMIIFATALVIKAVSMLDQLPIKAKYLDGLIILGSIIFIFSITVEWFCSIYPSSVLVIDKDCRLVTVPIPRKILLLKKKHLLRFKKSYIFPSKLNIDIESIEKLALISNPSKSFAKGRQYPAIVVNNKSNNKYPDKLETVILFTMVNGSFSSAFTTKHAVNIIDKLSNAIKELYPEFDT